MTDTRNKMILLHTNDLHSCFENMPKLAAAIRRYQSAYPPEQVLIADCGDHMDRMRTETEGTGGEANVAVLNAIGTEVFVPGNNEGLTFTRQELESALSGARFAVLCTNLREWPGGGRPDWLKRTLVLDKSGRKIGLIGVTARYNDFFEPLGWHAEDPFAAVEAAVTELRGQTDLLVVISHVGIRFDLELAERIQDIDCILGGHTHHLFERAERRGNVLVCAAGKSGTHLGVVEIEFAAGKGRPVSMDGYALRVTEEEGDADIESLIARENRRGRLFMDRPAAFLSEAIHHDPFGESGLGNLLADGLRKWTDSEIGLVNGGQLLGGLAGGFRSEYELHAICPSPINPCSLLISGRQILEALEQALDEAHIRSVIRGFGFRGEVLGTLCASGMTISYDAGAAPHHRVFHVDVGDRPLEPDRQYKVGTIDMFTFGAGYPALGRGLQVKYYLPEFLRDVLRRELADAEAVRRSKIRRFIPVSG